MFVGVDGCRGGWVAVIRATGSHPEARVFGGFAELLAAFPQDSIIAVDMPIGLPDRVERGGRGPEQAVRPLLGQRQSSVFSIPSRASVYAGTYREACTLALETSDPPRMVSRQAFQLFGKIREIDALITPQMQTRLREVHPELAFWRLNGEEAMALPKKIKGRINPDGMAERRELLVRRKVPAEFLVARPPHGASRDDYQDACACSLIAERIGSGEAKPFPRDPDRDSRGLEIAIWA